MADDTDAEFERHMADARKAAKSVTTTQTPPTAPASPSQPTDPEDAAYEQHMAAVRKAQPPPVTPAAAPPVAAGSWGGLGRNIAAGVLDAAGNIINTIANPSGTIGNLLAIGGVTGYDALAPVFGYNRLPNDVRNMLLGSQVTQPGTALINTIGNMQGTPPDAVPANTEAERLARKMTGGAGTAAMLGPAGIVAPIAGAAGALAGDQAAQLVPDWLKPGAELAGNVAGATATGVGAVGVRGVWGTGGGATPEVAQLAQLARDQYGIPIHAPQMGGSVMKIANDQSANLPFSGAGAAREAQQTAYNRAVANTFGETANRITPDVMDRAATRIGHDFDTVAARTNVRADPQFTQDLTAIEAHARATLTDQELGPVLTQLQNLRDAAAAGNGTIAGNVYQALTRATAPLGRTARNANSNISYYGQAVRDALDDAFQRSAAPADQALLQQARTQYRAMRTVEDLVEKSPTGDISPALLMGRVRAVSDRFNPGTSGMAYTGGGPLGDLARIGQAFLKPPPNSGTADRILVNSLAGGGAVSATIANPWNLLTVPGGLLANRLAGGYMRGDGLAGRVINSSLNPPNPLPNPLVSGVASDLEAERQRNALNR
jgi:hypothetical protein